MEETATADQVEPAQEVAPETARSVQPDTTAAAAPSPTEREADAANPAPPPPRKPERTEPTERTAEAAPAPPAKPDRPQLDSAAAAKPEPTEQAQPARAAEGQETDGQETVSGAGGKAGSGQQDAAGSGQSSAGGGSPGAHPDYFTKLRAWLERHKEYPRRARMRDIEGTATLRFVMNRDGEVLSFEVTGSSGHDMLDTEVREMIRRAQPLPALPDDMNRERLELEVPVRFAIR